MADSSANNSNLSITSNAKIVGFNMFSKKGFTGVSKYKNAKTVESQDAAEDPTQSQ